MGEETRIEKCVTRAFLEINGAKFLSTSAFNAKTRPCMNRRLVEMKSEL